MFGVIEFSITDSNSLESSNELAVVPLLWVFKNDSRCYWPLNTGQSTFSEFVKKQRPYKKSWPVFKIFKIHYKTGNFNSY